LKDLKNHNIIELFSGTLEALTNITRNVETPKEYGELKAQNIWQVL